MIALDDLLCDFLDVAAHNVGLLTDRAKDHPRPTGEGPLYLRDPAGNPVEVDCPSVVGAGPLVKGGDQEARG